MEKIKMNTTILFRMISALALAMLNLQFAIAERRSEAVALEVWVDKGNAAMYHSGERIGIYFHTNRDCYVLIYNIDTEGRKRILFPRFGDDGFVAGGVTHRLPDYYDRHSLQVSRLKGIEYIHGIATSHPAALRYDFLPNNCLFDTSPISGDPFEAINEINFKIIPMNHLLASSTTYFFVENFVWYPRYMCGSCHTSIRHRFDPYEDYCPNYQIISTHDDGYWWDIDYYPIQMNFHFRFPFWKWRTRMGFSPQHRYRSHPNFICGTTNYFSRQNTRHEYRPHSRRAVRSAQQEGYEREYRVRSSRLSERPYRSSSSSDRVISDPLSNRGRDRNIDMDSRTRITTTESNTVDRSQRSQIEANSERHESILSERNRDSNQKERQEAVSGASRRDRSGESNSARDIQINKSDANRERSPRNEQNTSDSRSSERERVAVPQTRNSSSTREETSNQRTSRGR